MQLVVPFAHLELLFPGLDLEAGGNVLAEQIRQHFAFLGAVEVALTSDSAILTVSARP
jgi:hypothetical protein